MYNGAIEEEKEKEKEKRTIGEKRESERASIRQYIYTRLGMRHLTHLFSSILCTFE